MRKSAGQTTIMFGLWCIVAFSGLSCTSLRATDAPAGTGGIMKPGPVPEAAVNSEYRRTSEKGTKEAYERFIRRHPGHPLALKAREAIKALERK